MNCFDYKYIYGIFFAPKINSLKIFYLWLFYIIGTAKKNIYKFIANAWMNIYVFIFVCSTTLIKVTLLLLLFLPYESLFVKGKNLWSEEIFWNWKKKKISLAFVRSYINDVSGPELLLILDILWFFFLPTCKLIVLNASRDIVWQNVWYDFWKYNVSEVWVKNKFGIYYVNGYSRRFAKMIWYFSLKKKYNKLP